MKNFVMCLVIGMFLVSLASASLNFSEDSLKTSYGTSELISGKFTISFENQSDSSFTSSFGGSKSLYNLLNSSGYKANTDFQCTPRDCRQAYSAQNGDSSKSISLTANENNVYGFLINGDGISLRNISFHIASDAGESCLNQLYLDLFDDGIPDFYNLNSTLSECGNRDYGCFDKYLVNGGEGEIQTTPYCQKIILPSAPAYKVGANIKNSTTSRTGILKMELYSENSPGNLLGKCNLPNMTSSVQDLDCVINYTSTKQFSALVCLSVNTDLAKYRINVAGGTQKCGKLGNENSDYTSNYEIYALPLKYGTINKIFNSALYSKLRSDSEYGLLDDVQKYLENRYGNHCNDGCVIPFSLSGPSQNVNINNVEIKYNTDGVMGLNSSSVYELGTKKMLISSLRPLTINFENLDIRTPSYSTTSKFELFFENKNLTGERLSVVSGIGFDITPKYVYIGQPILFSASLSNNLSSIKGSSWDFGDGTSVQSSTTGKVTHTYLNDGEYTINVNVVSVEGSSSTKNFKISVGNLYDSTRLLIAIDEGRIANLTSQISTYDSWIKGDIEKKANITQMSTEVAEVKRIFGVTDRNNSENLKILLGRLVKLDVPYSIIASKKGTAIPLKLGAENIDVSYLKSLSSNPNQISDSDLKERIQKWMENNYDSKMDFDVISRFGDLGVTPLLTRFSMNLNSKTETPAYLIIDYPLDSIKFKEKGNEKAVSTGTFIPVSGVQNIQFFLPGDIKVSEIGAYISPEISNLGAGSVGQASLEAFSWTKFFIGLLILLVLAGIVFYFGRRWYIYNYESQLFKNPKDLYNLINFIIAARDNKLVDSEIKRKLKSVGWNMEQIGYAFGKIKTKTSKVY